MELTKEIQKMLGNIEVGKARHFHNLTIFPLTGQNGHKPLYELLDAAINNKKAEITEVDEHGSVPTLKVHNRAILPLLIPEGEILIGAKQNRVINITVLVHAESEIRLPVSCVEAGRWHQNSRRFRSQYSAPPSVRARKTRSVLRNRAATGEALSDQGDVWACVAENLVACGAESETGSVTAAFEATESRRQEYRRHFRLPGSATGMLVTMGDRIVGLDLFDCHSTLKAYWQRLTDSYFLEAAHGEKSMPPASEEIARKFLDNIAENVRPAHTTIGAGRQIEVQAENLTGSGVWFEDHLCHLSVFAV